MFKIVEDRRGHNQYVTDSRFFDRRLFDRRLFSKHMRDGTISCEKRVSDRRVCARRSGVSRRFRPAEYAVIQPVEPREILGGTLGTVALYARKIL